jgi:uncharacterized protein (TIGR02145 family)
VEVTVTLNPPLTDVDGNSYCYGTFGSAGTWMTENLRVTHYANNTALTHNRNTSNYTDQYYAYPNENADGDAHVPACGLLYTWAAATNRTGVSADESDDQSQAREQGICPAGWHLPTDYEWSQLEKVIAEDSEGKYSLPATTEWDDAYKTANSFRGTHGQKMKSATATDVNYTTGGSSRPYVSGGFNALLAGYEYKDEDFGFGLNTTFWSSSYHPSTTAWVRMFVYQWSGAGRSYSWLDYEFSVRCKQN